MIAIATMYAIVSLPYRREARLSDSFFFSRIRVGQGGSSHFSLTSRPLTPALDSRLRTSGMTVCETSGMTAGVTSGMTVCETLGMTAFETLGMTV